MTEGEKQVQPNITSDRQSHGVPETYNLFLWCPISLSYLLLSFLFHFPLYAIPLRVQVSAGLYTSISNTVCLFSKISQMTWLNFKCENKLT